MAENGQVVQLAVAVLDMVAEQRFGAEADSFEARDRGTLIDGHLYAQLGQLKFQRLREAFLDQDTAEALAAQRRRHENTQLPDMLGP